jgi:hypothetical protein
LAQLPVRYILDSNRWAIQTMHNSGILIHAHHLETPGWQDLLWGDPATDTFGSLAALVHLLLTAPDRDQITTILVGCGPSHKNGLSEGAYTKQCMLSRFGRLADFPRLRPLIQALTPLQHRALRTKLEQMVVMPEVRRTRDEISTAAVFFAEHKAAIIYEISGASHAPRCIQVQAMARAAGLIPASQLWLLIATQACFSGASPDDTIVIEPPHRGDDALANHHHTMSEALKPYLYMPPVLKQELIDTVYNFTATHQHRADELLQH